MPATETHSRMDATLLSMGLVYLAVPNILFLVGWFTPPVAVAGCVLITIAVARACMMLHRTVETPAPASADGIRTVLFALFLLLLLTLHFLSGGIVGVCHTNWDYMAFRQALFCNMRDAAWPVVLPNGKEMSYYLAGILPPALAARVLPAAMGQWCIVFWTVIPVFMAVLLIAGGLSKERGQGLRTALAFVAALLLLRDPFLLCFPMKDGGMAHFLCGLAERVGVDFHPFLTAQYGAGVLNPLHECIGPYNSTPPTLLVTAMMLRGGRANRFLIPLGFSLLLFISPLACIGLLPPAILFYRRAWAGGRLRWSAVVWEAPLPALMVVLAGVYFARADGKVAATLTCVPWGVQGMLINLGRTTAAWLLLVLPLLRHGKRDGLFLITAAYLLLAPPLFIGSADFGMNELWLKSSPAYVMILALYWAEKRVGIPRVKYLVLTLCLLCTAYQGYKAVYGADITRYMQVEDIWNGHLNHGHGFLNQSVPPTKRPLVPGILLREGGASERHFPGKLLPHAPGCDYTRPMGEFP